MTITWKTAAALVGTAILGIVLAASSLLLDTDTTRYAEHHTYNAEYTAQLAAGASPAQVSAAAEGVCEVVYYTQTEEYRCELPNPAAYEISEDHAVDYVYPWVV